MGKIATAHVTPFDAFELWPEALARVQLRGIGRQALQGNVWCRALRQALLDNLTPMHRGPIPHDDHAAGYLAQELFETCDDICGVEGAVLAVAVHCTRRGDGGDGREMIMGVPLPQDRRLADRRRGAHDTGQGVKPGFV